jgi:hypothetical protein
MLDAAHRHEIRQRQKLGAGDTAGQQGNDLTVQLDMHAVKKSKSLSPLDSLDPLEQTIPLNFPFLCLLTVGKCRVSS